MAKAHIFRPCYECVKARIVQYASDPLIAECTVTGEKQVASTPVECSLFGARHAAPSIEHRKKRIGITNLYL